METSGRQLGDKVEGRQGAGHTVWVGDKVPRFPEPCAYMGVHWGTREKSGYHPCLWQKERRGRLMRCNLK
jgi:hypothetical protein